MYALIYVIFNSTVVMISLVLWLKLRKRSSYLLHRNFSMVLVLTLALVANFFAGALARISAETDHFLNSCFVSTFGYYLVVPCILLAQSVRVLMFLNRYKYNKNLSDTFVACKFHPENQDLGDAMGTLITMKKKTETFYGVKVAGMCLGIILLLALVLSSMNCPDLGTSERCDFEDFSEDWAITLSFYVLSVAVIAFIYYVHRKAKKYPDPFGILLEIKTSMLICVGIIFPTVFLSAFKLGEHKENEPYRFDTGLIVDLGVLASYYYSVPYQIYIGFMPKKDKMILGEFQPSKDFS